MSLWVLVWIVVGYHPYEQNVPIATGSAVFHSQKSCLEAAKKFKTAYCFEDAAEQK